MTKDHTPLLYILLIFSIVIFPSLWAETYIKVWEAHMYETEALYWEVKWEQATSHHFTPNGLQRGLGMLPVKEDKLPPHNWNHPQTTPKVIPEKQCSQKLTVVVLVNGEIENSTEVYARADNTLNFEGNKIDVDFKFITIDEITVEIDENTEFYYGVPSQQTLEKLVKEHPNYRFYQLIFTSDQADSDFPLAGGVAYIKDGSSYQISAYYHGGFGDEFTIIHEIAHMLYADISLDDQVHELRQTNGGNNQASVEAWFNELSRHCEKF